jgi:hypothetical protein
MEYDIDDNDDRHNANVKSTPYCLQIIIDIHTEIPD